MRIKVLMFAAAKEAAGSDALWVEVDESAQAADVVRAIGRAVPQLAELLPSCRIAVDCCYVADDQPVNSTSEVALIPPVSGG